MTKNLIGAIPLAMRAAAATAAAGLASLLPQPFGWVLAVAIYPLCVFALAGLVARSARRHVRRGRFERDPKPPLYRGRMIYGAAWTTIYYCKPLLHLAWSCPPLKAFLLRAFGYRGSVDATLYPDVWMRDLCLLDFGPGTYIANRVTLGTNLVRSDGQIQVGAIQTGRGMILGHLAMVGGGTEVGVAAKVGFNVRIGERVSIAPEVTVDGATRVMDDVVIRSRAYIGKGCVIHVGLVIPSGVVVPDLSMNRHEADLRAVLRSAELALAA